MAVRLLVAEDTNEDNQWLKVDHQSRYIVNLTDDWQFLFGPGSELTTSIHDPKVAARFDDNTFNNIRIVGYLYDRRNGATFNAFSCEFKIFKVTSNDWHEELLMTVQGEQINNFYFYANPSLTDLGLDFQGGDTLMIEATLLKFNVPYRERIYVNHLGIFDNLIRVKQEVDFLSITKKDL